MKVLINNMLLRQLPFVFCFLILFQSLWGGDFRVLSWEGNIEGWNYRDASGDILPLEIRESPLSRRVYNYSGSEPLEFLRIVEGPDGPQQQVMLSMPIPEDMEAGILMVIPWESEGASGIWIDASFDKAPLGCLRFFNFSNYPVALELDEIPIIVDPKKSHVYEVPAGVRAVPLRAATAEVDGEWRLFSTLPIPTRHNLRTFVVLRNARSIETRETGPVEMVLFHDMLRPKLPAQ